MSALAANKGFKEQVRDQMAEILRVPLARLTDDANLLDTVSESFVLVEMVIELQEMFNLRLTQDDLKQVRTVGDLLAVLETKRAK